MTTRRISPIIIILLLGLVLLSGVLFHSFILEILVRPLALVVWLSWRVLLSIDQKVYWALLIFLALFYALICLVPGPVASERSVPTEPSITLDGVHGWHMSICFPAGGVENPTLLRHALEKMLVTMYTSKQSELPYWQVHEALKQRQIPLPEPVYAFLFPAEPPPGRQSFKRILQAIWHAPGKLARRWAGRDVTEFYQSIEQVLNFMESSLEINRDDTHFDASDR
jgi:hypothetical protein